MSAPTACCARSCKNLFAGNWKRRSICRCCRGVSAIFVDQIAGSQRLVAMVGDRRGLSRSIARRTARRFLACLPPHRRAALLRRRLDRLTPHTKTTAQEVEAELRQFNEHQIAWDLEEHALGVCAAGTAFIDPLGRDYAISVPVPKTRFEAKREAMIRLLRDAQEQAIAAGSRLKAPPIRSPDGFRGSV